MIRWHHDPAFTGPRDRAFIARWQLIAYEDGRWEVRHNNQVVDQGTRGGRPGAMLAWMFALVRHKWLA